MVKFINFEKVVIVTMAKIVFASILKPVTDTRMYAKMAKTLVLDSAAEVHIVGHAINEATSQDNNIIFHPIFNFPRLSFARVFAWVSFLKLIYALKPQTIVVCTHELLLPAIAYKLFHKVQLIYDVRENYYLNILYTHSFPLLLQFPLALWVRFKELICSPFVNHFILAEACYQEECASFLSKHDFTLLPNQFVGPARINTAVQLNTGFHMVYSGTIAKSYGIWETINLAIALHQIDPTVRLTIIGYSASPDLLTDLESMIQNKPFITLMGGKKLVSHNLIMQTLLSADVAILSYQDNKSTRNRIPTKLYECLALGIPMILPSYANTWIALTKPYQAALYMDFSEYDAAEVYQSLLHQTFYTFNPPPESYQWQAQKLIPIFQY